MIAGSEPTKAPRDDATNDTTRERDIPTDEIQRNTQPMQSNVTPLSDSTRRF